MSSTISTESQPPAWISPFLPAAILERAGIKHCIVGTATLILFGSEVLIADLDLAVADEQYDLALSVLHNEGFCDIDFHYCRLAALPVLGKPGGWVARRLQYPPSSNNVVLTPASCWHIDINPDTTSLPYNGPYRFPSFLAYLEALIRTIDALASTGDRLPLFKSQYSIMVELLGSRPELREMISPGDQFFINFYKKQYSRPGWRKVLELRRAIIAGTISVDAARAVVPRPDLSEWRIKERQQRQRIAGVNAEGIAGGNVEGSAHVT